MICDELEFSAKRISRMNHFSDRLFLTVLPRVCVPSVKMTWSLNYGSDIRFKFTSKLVYVHVMIMCNQMRIRDTNRIAVSS